MDRKSKIGIDGTGQDGIAYGLIFVLVFLGAAAITIIAIFTMENSVLDVVNTFINQGIISQQTANAIEFNRVIGMTLPIIALGGCFLWSMMRGVQSRDNQTISGGAFYTGWIILVLCCITGFIMSFTGGLILDSLFTGLDSAKVIENPAMMTQEWSDVQHNTMYSYINMYYFLCYLTPLIGVAVFGISIVRRTVGSRYDYYGGGF
jgi:hypothetical protein